MMRVYLTLILSTVLVGCSERRAPTDAELLAGYCFGTAKGWIAMNDKRSKIDSEEFEVALKDMRDKMVSSNERLESYLKAKGLSLSDGPIAVAIANGESDVSRCREQGGDACGRMNRCARDKLNAVIPM